MYIIHVGSTAGLLMAWSYIAVGHLHAICIEQHCNMEERVIHSCHKQMYGHGSKRILHHNYWSIVFFCNLRTMLNNFERNAVKFSLMYILALFSWMCFLSSFLLDMTRFHSSLDMNRTMVDCGSPAGAPRGFGSLWLMMMSSRRNGCPTPLCYWLPVAPFTNMV